jgi:hypothetical protein
MDTGIAIIIAAIIAVVGYVIRTALDIIMREREQKEERYKGMLMSIKGFYEFSKEPQLKEKFIEETTMAYLYASDKVIQKANKFLDMVKTESKPSSDEDKRKALATLIISMRKDLKRQNCLNRSFKPGFPSKPKYKQMSKLLPRWTVHAEFRAPPN